MPSFILITVWPQYSNVTVQERQDRQRSDSIMANRFRSLYAIAHPSDCRLSVVCLSVTLVRLTQAVEIFGNISMAFGTLAIH